MQRLVERVERVSRVATRRLDKEKQHRQNGAAWERNQNKQRMVRLNTENIRQARRNRHLDWEAGPLAPRRDVGDKAETYGALDVYDVRLPEKDPEKRTRIFIKQMDRVVVTKGRERGKIGTVTAVDATRGSVGIKDVNKVDVFLPDWLKQEKEDTRKVAPQDLHVPIENVKLVYPLPDPKTGIPRDVIIDRLERVIGGGGGRAIAGTNTIIPYPEKVPREFEDHEGDTLRITVEEQTFRPFLLHPPMPMSVVDELRNKYSRFRSRHDYEYIQKKEAEDARVEKRKELGKTMRTPLQELAELRARQKKEPAELTQEQLAKIGEVMAQEQSRTQSAVQSPQ